MANSMYTMCHVVMFGIRPNISLSLNGIVAGKVFIIRAGNKIILCSKLIDHKCVMFITRASCGI